MNGIVAIIGRPNVGKSTLFNRLIGRRHALVDDTPGVTRDRRQGEAKISDLQFTIFDTAGLESNDKAFLTKRMRDQTEVAVQEADIVILMVDAKMGITPDDMELCRWLRRKKNDIILVANKCESNASESGILEAFNLGLGEPVVISAEHGLGMANLYAALRLQEQKLIEKDKTLPSHAEIQHDISKVSTDLDNFPVEKDREVLRLAIVGRPNVGKSTLINALLGQNRVLTGPEAGITRDSIQIEWQWKKKTLHLFDTAGLRRKSRVANKLERASGNDTWRAVRFAHVVVLVVDASMMLERQDLNIARLVIEEGRSLLIAVNKWDLIRNKNKAVKELQRRVKTSLPQVKDISYVPISALEKTNLDMMIEKCFVVYDVWNQRVPTAKLNRWFEAIVQRHPPPLVQGRRLKLRYITQIKTRPPSFACFCNQPDQVPESYKRYVINELRKQFTLPGVPIRLLMKTSKNPYA
ncbi:MAG: ribosome biogenesis GTPase Der [Pseudomonadota bacterium]|nr:ribosome biogenesis GTPase Der [Pseudomonadota bacterium]MEC8750913.1 ribosome biogenesis GTPase Der [Pseudomonadota bacterium]